MPNPKKNKEVNFDSFFYDLAQDVDALLSAESGANISILEFMEQEVSLGIKLTEQQQIILKVLYGLELTEADVSILEYWYSQGNTNWRETLSKNITMLILEAGRRCIASDTLIYTDKGLLTVSELGMPVEQNVWQDVNFSVLQEDKKVTKASRAIYSGVQKVVQVRTTMGFEIRGTQDHRLLVKEKEQESEDWKLIANIQTTDKLKIIRGGDLFCKEDKYTHVDKLYAIKAAHLFGIVNSGLRIGGVRQKSTNKRLYIKLGHLEAENVIEALPFSDLYLMTNRFKGRGAVEVKPDIYLDRTLATKIFDEVFNYKAELTEAYNVPLEIRSAPRHIQLAYLNGVFLTISYLDGNVIKLQHTSETFLRDIQLMLLNLNILSQRKFNKKSKKNILTELTVSEPYSLKKLLTEICSNIEHIYEPYKELLGIPCTEPSTVLYDRVVGKRLVYNEVDQTRRGTAQVFDIEVPENHYYVANGIVSHNSGKTTLASLIALYEFYCLSKLDQPQSLYGIASNTPIGILIIATTAEQAKKAVFRQVLGMVKNSKYFQRLQDKGELFVGKEEIAIEAKNLYIYSGNSRSAGQVGATLKCLIMDEVARFNDVDGDSNALGLWSNLGISCAPFKEHAKLVAISSAWYEGDAIQTLFERAFMGNSALAVRAKSWDLNPIHAARDNPMVASMYDFDPVKAATEFEGIRLSSADPFLSKEDIEACLTGQSVLSAKRIVNATSSLVELELLKFPYVGTECYLHIDPAVSRDCYALAFGHSELDESTLKVIIDGILIWEPGLNTPVSITNVYEMILQIHKRMPIIKVSADHYNSAETLERLRQVGIQSQQMFFSNREQLLMYDNLRQLLHERRISLPKDSIWTPLLERELKQVQLISGKKIDHPSKGSKDIADAIAAVAYNITCSDVRRNLSQPTTVKITTNSETNQTPMSSRQQVLSSLKNRRNWYSPEL